MSNAERCRRMAESSAKNGSALADGHELLFNLAYAFDPMLLRLALEEPGTVFAWGAAPIVGQVPAGSDPLGAAHVVDLSDGRKLYNRQLRRSEEHTSELQSLMRISYAVFCLKKKKNKSHIILIKKHY